MKYKLLTFQFYTGVHIGNGMLSDSNIVFYADTLFSALCHEAKNIPGGIDRLYDLFKQGRLRISDAMPYIGDTYYIPRPMEEICFEEGDSTQKKALKKLKYIPMQKLNEYLEGRLEAAKEERQYSELGIYEMRESAKINRGKDAEPFYIGIYHFEENCGLYICIGYEKEDDFDYLMELFECLSLVGIGGKRSAGLGKFEISMKKCPDEWKERFDDKNAYCSYMSLSLTIPQENEMETACDGAKYLLKKRSGFLSSESYGNGICKKQTTYVFDSGSTFKNKFQGDIYDIEVSGEKKHPVYRYAYPFFMGVTKL